MDLVKTLVLFSGLPGTGKSTLARQLARQRHVPLLAIDDVTALLATYSTSEGEAYWAEMTSFLLQLAAAQLRVGISVILDSVFMGPDRAVAQKLAASQGALYRPVHTFISDETLWEERVRQRYAEMPDTIKPDVATWERIQIQRRAFWPWQPGTALFIDSADPLNDNFAQLLAYIQAPDS